MSARCYLRILKASARNIRAEGAGVQGQGQLFQTIMGTGMLELKDLKPFEEVERKAGEVLSTPPSTAIESPPPPHHHPRVCMSIYPESTSCGHV